MSDIPEEIRKMFPDQPVHKLDIDDNGELHILASAEPLNDPEFENMPIEQVNQYLREHGYDPEQVGIHGKILTDALIEYIALRAERDRAREMVTRLIEVGNVLVDQNDFDNGAVMAAEDEWRALVAEAQKGNQNV